MAAADNTQGAAPVARRNCSASDIPPEGSCFVTSYRNGSFRIDRADPRVLISAELLDDIADHRPDSVWLNFTGCSAYDGALLKIRGVNRTVIYRITCYIPALRSYLAEWPD